MKHIKGFLMEFRCIGCGVIQVMDSSNNFSNLSTMKMSVKDSKYINLKCRNCGNEDDISTKEDIYYCGGECD